MTSEERIQAWGEKYHEVLVNANTHRASYVTATEYWGSEGFYTAEQLEECEAAGACWTIQVYPDTPGSSYTTCGPTLTIALDRMQEILERALAV